MKKLLKTLTFGIIFSLLLSNTAYALEKLEVDYVNPIPKPLMTYINEADTDIDIDGSGNVTVSASIYAYSNVDKVKIISRLQRYRNGKWRTVKSFTKSKKKNYASLEEEYSVSKGYYYRVKTTFIAYDGYSNERKTIWTGSEKY